MDNKEIKKAAEDAVKSAKYRLDNPGLDDCPFKGPWSKRFIPT